MINIIKKSLSLLLVLFIAFTSCKTEDEKPPEVKTKTKKDKKALPSVSFNADSAYHFIKKQVEFGPRVPGTPAHDSTVKWMVKKLSAYTDKVKVQKAQVTVFNNKQVPMKNIIASFNPDKNRRVLLAAHYDTRPFADQASEDRDKPIPGANDGGSGVGVLLEIARQLQQNTPDIGIDIILFDVEDYGQPGNSPFQKKQNTWALGSQYWSKTPHKRGYNAQYGILLDMVGAKGAKFTMEGTSMHFAPSLMRKVWTTAWELGYGEYFLFEHTSSITDDHYYINKYAKIPTIDIIQHDFSTPTGFGSYWHTHEDDMNVISKATLNAVGQTVLTFIYQELEA